MSLADAADQYLYIPVSFLLHGLGLEHLTEDLFLVSLLASAYQYSRTHQETWMLATAYAMGYFVTKTFATHETQVLRQAASNERMPRDVVI